YYVAIQPIDVCATGGTGCAPFNTVSSTGSPTTVSSTNPIGFVDSTGQDVTRAMWNQIGVDISWAPMKQYNNTSYNSITIGSAAPNFNTLTQQTGISTGTAPTAPLNSSPYALNMFFVTNLSPAAGTTG